MLPLRRHGTVPPGFYPGKRILPIRPAAAQETQENRRFRYEDNKAPIITTIQLSGQVLFLSYIRVSSRQAFGYRPT